MADSGGDNNGMDKAALKLIGFVGGAAAFLVGMLAGETVGLAGPTAFVWPLLLGLGLLVAVGLYVGVAGQGTVRRRF